MQTVVELPEYLRNAGRLLNDSEQKSGGVQVVYYYNDERIPLYLLTVFRKGEQANLSKADRKDLAQLVGILVATALRKS